MANRSIHPDESTIAALDVGHPRLITLLDYWRGKLGGRAMPSRGDIDPLEMKEWLGDLVLVEFFDGVKRYCVRIDGTNVVEIGGPGRTGKGPEVLTSSVERDLLFSQYSAVLEQRKPAYYETDFTNSEGRYLHEFKLLLPLSADGATVNMILAGIYYHLLESPAFRSHHGASPRT